MSLIHDGLFWLPPRPPQRTSGGAKVQQTAAQPKKPTLRQDWTFLDDPLCPPELQILAARKITAYKTAVAAHKRLFDCTTAQQQFDTVKQLTEAFIENDQIFQEFSHYAKTGKLLSIHPVFAQQRKLKELQQLPPVDLYKTAEKLKHNIWRLKHVLDNPAKQHLRVKRESMILEKEQQLQYVERLLQ